MWPMKLDMTRDECRGVLRRLELESYSSVMSTFRAQGALCKEKARILDELRKQLHISQDRHKAEARRVANDERLTTVAEFISGPNSSQDWCREGRRTFPILPRTAPYTALSYIANTVCEQISRENSKLPHPFETSQNRLEKEEEEEKKQLLEQQQKQEQQQQQQQQELQQKQEKQLQQEEQPQTQSQPPVKPEHEPVVVTPAPTPEPIKQTPPPVVTNDPFVEAANKSYINNDLKRSYPIEPNPSLSIPAPIDDECPLKKKPQLYQELQKQEPLLLQNPIVTFHQQPYQQPFPLQQPLSPHKSLSSPNNFGMPATNNNNNNNFNTKPTQGKNSNKNTERQRKTSHSSKKNQNKNKTPYQSNKTTGGAKTAKNMVTQPQQQQQLQIGGPMSAPAKGGGKGGNISSPHLIHSYASPLLPYEIPLQGIPEMPNEPLQLHKHLTSNIVYQPQQSQQAYGITGSSMKSFGGSYSVQPQVQQPIPNMSPNPMYGQHQILPSSKKDIQYNLTKLNPTNNMPMKNNVNIPLKQSSSIMQGKGHPLFNYQKKSPSKNVLIPTSSAAAALASFGLPKAIQRKDTPVAKFREPDPVINPADIPNPKIIFSTAGSLPPPLHHQQFDQPQSHHLPAGNQITILDQITLHPPNTIIQASSAGGVTISSPPPMSVTHITPIPAIAPISSIPFNVAPPKPISAPSVPPVATKVVSLKGPNLAGFTPVKSGSKLSVHKLQLVPISHPGGKNNVILLPSKGASNTTVGGTLNPGQKITIPKSSVVSNVIDQNVISVAANTVSPPKVIVQQQPDLNNIVVFDIGSDQKLKTTSGVLGSQQQQQQPPPQSKSVITEDTPVDIVSTPLDVVTGAVKLQELTKGFLSPGSSSGSGTTASPLTEKMVKPQSTAPKYNTKNSNITKATKFEADSTAPGPSVTITKKSRANHQGKGANSVQSNKAKSKLTTAVASSTTAGSDIPARTPVMSSTDWELELDQANQATNVKTINLVPKTTPKPTLKSNPAAAVVPKPLVAPSSSSSHTGSRRAPQPLSSSSISSTSSSSASSPVVDHPVSNDVRIAPLRPVIPVPVPTTPTPPAQKVIPLPVVTTPPNERSDDTSATDSADAEEDPEVGEEDEPIEEEMIIDDEQHFHAVIEEDPDLDETFNEQEIHGERVEIVNVGYDTSRALIADLEGAESASSVVVQGSSIVYGKNANGVEINPSSMNFEQYIEEAEGDAEANGDTTEGGTQTKSVAGNSKNIMFEMLELDSEGNKHTRMLSYEEALAEGQITADGSAVAKITGGSSGSGTVKGKTKSTS